MQESNVPISKSDDDKSDREINCDEAKHVVPDLIKQSCIVAAASNEENGVADLNALISPALDLHEEVVHCLCEKQDKIFVQVSEKVSLDESTIADRNVSVGFHETSEISFLMIDECNENLAVISYEDDLPYIQTTKDQTIQDSISDSSSYVSCFEMLFQEEIYSSTCSDFFEAQEHTFTEVHDKDRSESEEKDTLFFQQEERLHVFQDPMADLLQSTVKVIIAVFSDEGEYGQLYFWMPSYQYSLLTRRSDQENQSRRHLLDWLHWHFDIV